MTLRASSGARHGAAAAASELKTELLNVWSSGETSLHPPVSQIAAGLPSKYTVCVYVLPCKQQRKQ